jgi:hypothetical protein
MESILSGKWDTEHVRVSVEEASCVTGGSCGGSSSVQLELTRSDTDSKVVEPKITETVDGGGRGCNITKQMAT